MTNSFNPQPINCGLRIWDCGFQTSPAQINAFLIRNPQSTIINPQYEGAPWGPVYGELLTFDDPENRLPAIDRLEGFHPGGPSLYRRVLVPIQVNRSVLPAWLYVGEDPISKRFTPLGESCWPR